MSESRYKCCPQHTAYRKFNRLYYSRCIYCILDGKDWGEEWDSWAEIADRVADIVKIGYLDAKNGMIYKYKKIEKTPKNYNNKNQFQKLYSDGVKMWKDLLKEQPKDEDEIFPEGYDQSKYDKLCNLYYNRKDDDIIDIVKVKKVSKVPKGYKEKFGLCGPIMNDIQVLAEYLERDEPINSDDEEESD